MSNKVLIAAPVHQILTSWLTANGYDCIVQEAITQVAALQLVSDCAGIITSTRLQINQQLIDAAPHLQWVGRMGSGMEVIDVSYAESRGIKCYSSPEGNMNAVAEHALGMLLTLNKRILKSAEEVKQGLWLRDENRGIELEGKTVGIIGFGHTGSCFARKLYGFDVRILGYDKYKTGVVPKYWEECASLDPIYNEADIISFHVPYKEETHHYFCDAFLAQMKKPFILVNTSRGKVIDTAAVWNGLQNGRISGVCLDVWEEEPIEKMGKEMKNYLDKITRLPNAVVTPHIAGYSREAVYKMSKSLLSKIVMKR